MLAKFAGSVVNSTIPHAARCTYAPFVNRPVAILVLASFTDFGSRPDGVARAELASDTSPHSLGAHAHVGAANLRDVFVDPAVAVVVQVVANLIGRSAAVVAVARRVNRGIGRHTHRTQGQETRRTIARVVAARELQHQASEKANEWT